MASTNSQGEISSEQVEQPSRDRATKLFRFLIADTPYPLKFSAEPACAMEFRHSKVTMVGNLMDCIVQSTTLRFG
jgi:hypothetical protein